MLCSAPRWRGADLSHVIGNADAINHDIVSRADLADSFGKLTSAGLVRLEERIRLTRSGRALVRRAAGRTVHEHLRGVEKELSTLDPPTEWTPWVLSEDAQRCFAAVLPTRTALDSLIGRMVAVPIVQQSVCARQRSSTLSRSGGIGTISGTSRSASPHAWRSRQSSRTTAV